MAKALADKRFDVAVDVLGTAAGSFGLPSLFTCPQCGAGYVELALDFAGTYKKGDDATQAIHRSLVASCADSRQEAERFIQELQVRWSG